MVAALQTYLIYLSLLFDVPVDVEFVELDDKMRATVF
jgi:hypothetical protein